MLQLWGHCFAFEGNWKDECWSLQGQSRKCWAFLQSKALHAWIFLPLHGSFLPSLALEWMKWLHAPEAVVELELERAPEALGQQAKLAVEVAEELDSPVKEADVQG